VAAKEGSPGSEVTIDLTLAGTKDAKSLTARVEFAKALLGYTRAEAPSTDLTLDAKVTDDKAKPDMVAVEVSVKPTAGGALPEGPVGQLYFTIAADPDVGTVIPLKAEASAALGDATAPKPIKAVDGQVKVVESLIFSCFFYMH
jgi:hypothetical protein